jgi:hypothetical protein
MARTGSMRTRMIGLLLSLSGRGFRLDFRSERHLRRGLDSQSGESLIGAVGPGAKEFTETLIRGGTQVQIVRNRRDHQPTVFARLSNPLDGPEPIRYGVPEEWAARDIAVGPITDH